MSNPTLQSQGIVTSFMPDKGYGFIRGEDGRDYFVHASAIAHGEVIFDRQKVAFTGEPTPKGYRAVDVVPGARPPTLGHAYEEPRDFIMTHEPKIRGYETLFTFGWASLAIACQRTASRMPEHPSKEQRRCPPVITPNSRPVEA